MGHLTNSTDRLRRELRDLVRGKVPESDPKVEEAELRARQIARLWDRTAAVLLEALSDEEHRLSKELKELQVRVKWEKEHPAYESPSTGLHSGKKRKLSPHRHLFMPHPGASDPKARRLWQLQLLLQTATRSPEHRDRLADKLQIAAPTLKEAAEEAQRFSTFQWSKDQYLQYLWEAAADLAYPDPPLPFRLEGRLLIYRGGTTVRLSPDEANYLGLLCNQPGKAVSRKQFQAVGIKDPVQVKYRLQKKLERHNVSIPIISDGDFTVLPEQ